MARVSAPRPMPVGAFTVENAIDLDGRSIIRMTCGEMVYVLSLEEACQMAVALERFNDFADARGR